MPKYKPTYTYGLENLTVSTVTYDLSRFRK